MPPSYVHVYLIRVARGQCGVVIVCWIGRKQQMAGVEELRCGIVLTKQKGF